MFSYKWFGWLPLHIITIYGDYQVIYGERAILLKQWRIMVDATLSEEKLPVKYRANLVFLAAIEYAFDRALWLWSSNGHTTRDTWKTGVRSRRSKSNW
jgi:hypothetical protein